MRGLEIRMLKARVFRIKAKVQTPPVKVDSIVATLLPADNLGATVPGTEMRTVIRPGESEMTFDHVPSGRYGLQLRATIAAQAPLSAPAVVTVSFSQQQFLQGTLPVVVGDRNIDNLEVPLFPGVDIQGTVRFLNPPGDAPGQSSTPMTAMTAGKGAPLIRRASVSLRATTGLLDGITIGTSNPDGSLLLKAVRPGRYQLAVSAANGYVRSARFGGQDVTHQPFDVTSGGTLDIVIAQDGASLTGSARDSKGDLVTERMVAIWDASADASGYRYIGMTILAANGTYGINNMPPGDYRVLALDYRSTAETFPNVIRAPEFLTQFDSQAARIRLEPATSARAQPTTLEVPLLPRTAMDAALSRLP
jgi:hypothetical protein